MFKARLLLCCVVILLSWDIDAQQTRPLVSDSVLVIDQIVPKGNKITRNKIILRELEFKTGDTLFSHQLITKINQSRQNLLNLGLFNFVEIIPQRHDFNKITVLIRVTERWYIWPIPILTFADRNFNAWWKNRDFTHTNFGLDIRNKNFRGRRENLDLIIQGGYDKSLQLEWLAPSVNKKMTWGIGIWGGVIFNHETDYDLKNNKLVYYADPHHYVRKYYFAQLSAYNRPKFHHIHSFFLSYKQYRFADSLLKLNPHFTYGESKFTFLSLEYNFKLDHRDFAPYPLHGYYFEADALKEGLGLISKTINSYSFSLIFDQYLTLHKKWYFAYNLSVKTSNSSQPYFLQQGLGYKPMNLRGYQLYVINGSALAMVRSNLKYNLIPKTIGHIPFVKSEKFNKFFYALYVNLFFDAGYVSNHQAVIPQPLNNRLLYGTGIGLDYVTYYDVVFRIEYTLNREGEKGFFISFVAPI